MNRFLVIELKETSTDKARGLAIASIAAIPCVKGLSTQESDPLLNNLVDKATSEKINSMIAELAGMIERQISSMSESNSDTEPVYTDAEVALLSAGEEHDNPNAGCVE